MSFYNEFKHDIREAFARLRNADIPTFFKKARRAVVGFGLTLVGAGLELRKLPEHITQLTGEPYQNELMQQWGMSMVVSGALVGVIGFILTSLPNNYRL